MAEVLCKGSLFSPFLCRFSSSSSIKTKASFTNFSNSTIGALRSPSPSETDLLGRRLIVERQQGEVTNRGFHAVPVKTPLSIGKNMRWWEKGAQPNMKEISSAQDLVDSLILAGNKLVILDFFSPGCAGCRALHPKICQFAEQNPDVLFLPVNYEEHKSMCYSLNVHVLPFFRFYRGAHGRLCSFSCTNSTIKKFRDAMAKHNTERCSLGAPKGLEESELLALASNKDLSFDYIKKEGALSTSIEVIEPVLTIPELSLSQVPIPT